MLEFVVPIVANYLVNWQRSLLITSGKRVKRYYVSSLSSDLLPCEGIVSSLLGQLSWSIYVYLNFMRWSLNHNIHGGRLSNPLLLNEMLMIRLQ